MSLVEGAAVGCDINEFASPLDMHLSLKEESFDMLALTRDLLVYGPATPPLLESLSSIPAVLKAGTVVVALWSEGWYRAALLADVSAPRPETVVDVRFVDYGNCDQVFIYSYAITVDVFDSNILSPSLLLLPMSSLRRLT